MGAQELVGLDVIMRDWRAAFGNGTRGRRGNWRRRRMVFCCDGDVFTMEGKSLVVFIGVIVLFCLVSAVGGSNCDPKWKGKKKRDSISSIFASRRDLVCSLLTEGRSAHTRKTYRASFTVEAAMILSIVIFSLGMLISHVYRVHDTVTGTMILQEVLVKGRNALDDDEKEMVGELEAYGEELGDPRLWLGRYDLEVKSDMKKLSGKAKAGDWEQEIELRRFQPGEFLRKYEAIRGVGEELANDGSGISAGNESELYGGTAGNDGK